ncbi:DUF488 domain-containing protein [Desulfobacterota bacterium AH_259_B03_O07]|nr:DUF488 domain-containing protein [Desulfobacterota bacterium AH_259_B03_O07]
MSNKLRIIFTIGHSTRSFEEFVGVLETYKIDALVDVRHFPHSRKNPQFNQELIDIELSKHGIEYLWIERLGGFRTGGYEKYMKTQDFMEGFNKLTDLAKQKMAAVMCAELLWFKCHRSFIATVLTKSGWEVIHIYDERRTQTHKLLDKEKNI